MNEANVPTMLSIRETSERVGLPYDRLRKLCLQNKIVYIRSGSKIYINFDRLVDYLNQGEGVNHVEA